MANLLMETKIVKWILNENYKEKKLKEEAKVIRKNYKMDMKNLKKEYFRKAILIYLDLCNYCSDEVKLFPKLLDKEKFQKELSKMSSKAQSSSELIELIIEYIIDNHENFDEFLNELFSEIERLNNK